MYALGLTALFFCIAIPGFPVISFFEWELHLKIMHSRLWWLMYPFNAHALVHHRIFKADKSYHLDGVTVPKGMTLEECKKKIPMAWWNILVLAPIATVPFALFGCIFIAFGWWPGFWVAVAAGLFDALVYYGVYEYIHVCFHDPRDRWIERRGWFKFLKGHHWRHHANHEVNGNVVLPLADYLFGTLVLDSTRPIPATRSRQA